MNGSDVTVGDTVVATESATSLVVGAASVTVGSPADVGALVVADSDPSLLHAASAAAIVPARNPRRVSRGHWSSVLRSMSQQ